MPSVTLTWPDAAAAFVSHSHGVTVLPDGQSRPSSIYSCFREDFGGNEAGVIAHLGQFAASTLSQRLAGRTSLTDDAYDWALNHAPAGS